MESILQRLRSLDAFPKTLDEFTVRTSRGACLSLLAVVTMLVLIISEAAYVLSAETTTELIVDTSRHGELRINFDVKFPKTPCVGISVDATDLSGKQRTHLEDHIWRKRLSSSGALITVDEEHAIGNVLQHKNEFANLTAAAQVTANAKAKCGDCYGAGAVGACCNTCDAVRDAYRSKGWSMPPLTTVVQCNGRDGNGGFVETLEKRLAAGEGCQLYGFLDVARVEGKLHFGPSKSFLHAQHHVGNGLAFTHRAFNAGHEIVKLSFGTGTYPGQRNPLEEQRAHEKDSVATKSHPRGAVRFSEQGKGMGIFQYFLKVVPTEYVPLPSLMYPRGETVTACTYSVTRHFQHVVTASGRSTGVPGVHFKYDVSEIKARHVVTRRSFSHFLTAICAIVGGVYTIVGLLDNTIHSLAERRSGAILQR